MSAANSVNVTGNKIRTATDVFPFGMTIVFSPLSQITLLNKSKKCTFIIFALDKTKHEIQTSPPFHY